MIIKEAAKDQSLPLLDIFIDSEPENYYQGAPAREGITHYESNNF